MTPYYSDEWLTVYGGDCRAVLREMEPESVHCVVTSPPYFGLRDYGTATWTGGDEGCDHKPDFQPRSERPNPTGAGIGKSGYKGQEPVFKDLCGKCGATRIDSQLGLEETPEQYVAALVDVFREVRRVLRSDGTLWLNLGDSYANDTKWGGSSGGKHVAALHGQTGIGRQKTTTGLKSKDLVGIPWRVAFALQADGWWLRSEIIWAKPNPMPESVTDRPTKSHEYLFLLAKSARYFFDADAVREPDAGLASGNGFAGRQGGARQTAVDGGNGTEARFVPGSGRNLRSVWTIATAPYPGAHFATFPPKLVEPCVKAGTSEKGVCSECGAPWERVVERVGYGPSRATRGGNASSRASLGAPHKLGNGTSLRGVETTGWRPTCAHTAEPVPGVVMDPFAGTGTVGLVAQSLSRRAVLIDLNPDYLRQCLERNRDIPLGLPA